VLFETKKNYEYDQDGKLQDVMLSDSLKSRGKEYYFELNRTVIMWWSTKQIPILEA